MRVALLACLITSGCFPVRSQDFACETTSDCDADRVCQDSFCVLAERPDNGGNPTADGPPDGPIVDAPPDADPFVQIAMQCMTVGYTLVSGPTGYYRTVTTGTSWANAQADCKNDVADATHLIVLSTAAEVTHMASQLGWIGLSDSATEGVFVTVTGETGDQRPFASGQPDNGSGSEDCVQMKQGGQLDDDQCGNNHRYVCECDGKPSTP